VQGSPGHDNGVEARTEILARSNTPHGEIALRRRGDVIELIVNGVFAMDSTQVTSEVDLADAAGERPGVVVVGGLGLGYTAARLLANGARFMHVVELARPLIDWAVAGVTEQLQLVAHDPRVRLHHADIAEWLPRREESFDAILLDVDNGPGFLIHDHNARVYAADWLASAVDRLAPGGVLVIWCESPSPDLALALAALGEVTERVVTVEREGRIFDYALYLLRRDDTS
jgi:spermidine synthase